MISSHRVGSGYLKNKLRILTEWTKLNMIEKLMKLAIRFSLYWLFLGNVDWLVNQLWAESMRKGWLVIIIISNFTTFKVVMGI